MEKDGGSGAARELTRYAPKEGAKYYRREPEQGSNGSHLVDGLTGDAAESSNGERQRQPESGSVQERLSYINQEQVKPGSARSQRVETDAVATPQPRPREEPQSEAGPVIGYGGRVDRLPEQVRGASSYDKYLHWRSARNGPSGSSRPQGAHAGQGSFVPQREQTSMQARMAENGTHAGRMTRACGSYRSTALYFG